MHRYTNNEFMALLHQTSINSTDYQDGDHCIRYGIARGSSVYAHERDGHNFYTATGDKAVEWCESLLGRHTKLDHKDYKTWFIYD